MAIGKITGNKPYTARLYKIGDRFLIGDNLFVIVGYIHNCYELMNEDCNYIRRVFNDSGLSKRYTNRVDVYDKLNKVGTR